jgi:hypothetical protein
MQKQPPLRVAVTTTTTGRRWHSTSPMTSLTCPSVMWPQNYGLLARQLRASRSRMMLSEFSRRLPAIGCCSEPTLLIEWPGSTRSGELTTGQPDRRHGRWVGALRSAVHDTKVAGMLSLNIRPPTWEAVVMRGAAPTVPDLVARFALRQRATTDAFSYGVWLASVGAVLLGEPSDGRVSAMVRDPGPLAVTLVADDEILRGECECQDESLSVCRHQVAVAHAVWAAGRPDASGQINDSAVFRGDCGVMLRTMLACPDDPGGPHSCSCGAEIVPQTR